ncbi:DUF2868 domain-containing protein [Alkalimonas sp. MEB108]|uniref:DUF2868 domain-containing protein n=1 Tax=Alkalimonas cellulosilytica TaxID=3058395 RepID=A0ABU7J6A7_9GAMM|nr:DUF2868 domain-containing protein [Alkalimonas sp. MEB108]MEE2002036.1 DUF2868 domain-containing protein [Alkalimonas sp. MEB108]
MALSAVSNQLVLPWWRWPLAGLLGIVLGAASLNYSADGRLNVLLLWLLWAGLPLLGSLLALGLMLRPGRPWLARFSKQPLYWQPQRHQQWWLLSQLNWLWCWFGLGIGLVFLLLLLLSDLAFGWSSTLLLEQRAVLQLTQWLSWPWHSLWPAAVPDNTLIEQSRFARIEQQSALLAQTSGWWPFLAMSLLCYNLLPRLALALFCQWQSRRSQPQLQIQQASPASSPAAEPAAELTTTSLAQWQQASLLQWQLPASAEALTLGQDDWQQDNDAFGALLATKPKQLLWRVPASRSPVAELSDWMALARKQGIAQALWLQQDTSNARHSASWQAFARAEQLAWLEENA